MTKKKLIIAFLLGCISSLAYAYDPVANAYSDHSGRLHGWILKPEVILKHCVIHAPAMAPKMQQAYASWLSKNTELIAEAKAVVSESARIFAPMLRMTVEQAEVWQLDSVTMTLEEISFWRKGRIEVYSVCAGYENMVAEHESERMVKMVRDSLGEIQRLKAVRSVDR